MARRTAPGSPATTTVAGPAREDWDQFRHAVRALLHDQPSPNLVRAAARRLTLYVLAQAEAEVIARAEPPEAEHN